MSLPRLLSRVPLSRPLVRATKFRPMPQPAGLLKKNYSGTTDYDLFDRTRATMLGMFTGFSSLLLGMTLSEAQFKGGVKNAVSDWFTDRVLNYDRLADRLMKDGRLAREIDKRLQIHQSAQKFSGPTCNTKDKKEEASLPKVLDEDDN